MIMKRINMSLSHESGYEAPSAEIVEFELKSGNLQILDESGDNEDVCPSYEEIPDD